MAQVEKYKDHPAVLSWYLIDEPDGGSYPPEYVKEAAALIRSLDRSHPISACFDTTNRADGPWRAVPGGAVPDEFASGRRQSHHRTHRSSQRCRFGADRTADTWPPVSELGSSRGMKVADRHA